MKKEDFKFVDSKYGFWLFDVTGETKDELIEKYKDFPIGEDFLVGFDTVDGWCGIWYRSDSSRPGGIITSDDNETNALVQSMVFDHLRKMKNINKEVSE